MQELEWISVEDRPPTRDDANAIGKVLGYLEGYGIVHEYSWTDVRDKLYGITHWMPMPKFSKPPKKLKLETKLVFHNISREKLTFLRDKMNEALSHEPEFSEFTWELSVEGRPEITEVYKPVKV